MNHEIERPVGDYAADDPWTKRVFEEVGIDYCCGGRRTLGQACADAGIVPTLLLAKMAEAKVDGAARMAVDDHDHAKMSLAALADHIVRRHHVFTRDENARLAQLMGKVGSVHGSRHGELLEMERVFRCLRLELENHMLREERVLFPYISLMESSLAFGSPVPPAHFGSTKNPVKVMIRDHEAAAEMFEELRRLSGDFVPPEGACVTYRTLFEALAGLEKDLHQHIHLENNILFPKAIKMEQRAGMVSQTAGAACSHESTG